MDRPARPDDDDRHAGGQLTALALTRVGSGPPLVLLHALGAHRGIWGPVLAPLRERRELFAFDLPGFGDSPPLRGEATPARIAAIVSAEMRTLGIEDYSVAGNSFGGWVALEMALQGDARSVVAIAPAGLWRAPLKARPLVGQAFARALYPLLPALVRVRPLRRAILGAQVARPDAVPPAALLELLRRYARARGLGPAQQAMRAGTFSALDRISVPVTLVWPERDRIVARPRSLPAQVANIALSGCGHLPQWDDPQAVADALLAGTAADERAAPSDLGA